MDYSSSHHYSLSTSQISAINVAGGANSTITQNNSINTSAAAAATNVAAAAAAIVASSGTGTPLAPLPPPFQVGGSSASPASAAAVTILPTSASAQQQQQSSAAPLGALTPPDHSTPDNILISNEYASLSHLQGPKGGSSAVGSSVCTVTPASGTSHSIKSEYHPNSSTLASLAASRSSSIGNSLAGSYLGGQCTDYYSPYTVASHTSHSNTNSNGSSNFQNYSFYSSLNQNTFGGGAGVNGSSPGSTTGSAYHGHPHNSPPQHVTPSAAFLSNMDVSSAATTSHAYPKAGSYEFGHGANMGPGTDLFYPSSNSLFHAATGYLFPNATHSQQYYYTPSMQTNTHASYPNANVLTNYMPRSSLNGPGHQQTPTAAVNINVSCNIAGNGSSSISPEEHSSQQTTPQGMNSTEHTTSPVAKCNTHSAAGYDFLEDPKQGFASLCNNNAIFNHDQLSPPHDGYNALQVTDPDMMKGTNPHGYGSGMHESRKFAVAPTHLLRSSPGSLTDSKTSPIDTHLSQTLNGTSGGLSNGGVNLPYSWMKIKRNQSHLQCKYSISIHSVTKARELRFGY